jgi:hypothetical protein
MKRRPSPKQIRKWTAKYERILAEENLAPIPDHKPWTFSGKSSLVIVPHATDDDGNVLEIIDGTPVHETPQAELWRQIGIVAHDLPRNYFRRRFLIDWSVDGNLLRAARDNRLSRNQGRIAVKEFCLAYGFPLEGKTKGASTQIETFRNPCRKVKGRCMCSFACPSDD